MSETWVIGLSSWIVQDGNYADFACSQQTAFAVEFEFREAPVMTAPTRPEAKRLAASFYEVSGEVVVAEPDVWVVDCGGLLAYGEHAPPVDVLAGATVSGTVALGVDPFFYFERLADRDGMPPLIYDWQIERIELETTPRQQPDPHEIVRDESKASWREVDATDAWKDDGGDAHYLLHCRRLTGQPRRRLHASA